jgi:T5SS/PEP-CTERM-associated repeat protein
MQRLQRGCLIVALMVGSATASRTSKAQYTDNYQTNTISGVISNWLGDYIVGGANFADALLIQGGGVLHDANGYLGQSASSSNNTVLVSDSGSVWSNSGSLTVGYNGSDNQLIISNGGAVYSSDSLFGYNSSSANTH